MPISRPPRGSKEACALFSILVASAAQAQQPPVAQAVAAAPTSAPMEEEDASSITVVGERLRRAGGAIGYNPITGKMKCRVTNPSGDNRIDAAACEIALRCAKQDRRDRNRFTACVEAGYEGFLDSYFMEPQG